MSGAECTIWLRVLAEARTLEGFGGSLTKQEGVVGIGGSFKICGCLNKDGSGEGPHICVCMWCVCVCVCVKERETEQIQAFWKTIWQETHQIAISGFVRGREGVGFSFFFPIMLL